MILDKDAENTINRTCEKQGSFKGIRSKNGTFVLFTVVHPSHGLRATRIRGLLNGVVESR